jgi:hypothetical protein
LERGREGLKIVLAQNMKKKKRNGKKKLKENKVPIQVRKCAFFQQVVLAAKHLDGPI